ncbi:site-specific DNA-methyltransferase [Dietzia psychralcaliphila]|nr:site-specific DNA-methyltransferase [Dietzia psychralcaliphila]
MTSPDLTANNVAKIAELFPSVVTESIDADGKLNRVVDFDLLRQELSGHIVEGPQERYQLDWPGKRAASFVSNAPIAKALRPVRGESVDFDTTKNLFIQGDNLDALKLLQESYLGKVNLIYIDPPYNTGNDFIYEDDFAETADEYLVRSGQRASTGEHLVAHSESNGRFHSDWLSMMYPRVKLARQLLADNGVFVAAIDDHEHANLRAMLDSVFGAENFLANVVWQGSGKNDARFTSGGVDYMLVYARSKATLVENDVRFKGPKRGYDDVVAAGQRCWKEAGGDPVRATERFRAWWRSKPDVEPGLTAYSEIDGDGRIFTRDNLRSPNPRENLMYDVPHPRTGLPVKRHPNGWVYARERMQALIGEGRILFGVDHTTTPRLKRFLSDTSTQAMRPVISKERAPASDALARLLGGKYFDYPKDVGVLETWINALTGNDKEAVVLDFFGGSASTAHAVMALNASDGGSRRFILVQLDEPSGPKSFAAHHGFTTIAEISRERLRRAGVELKGRAGLLGESLDVGFRALRVDTTNLLDFLRTPDDTNQLDLTGLQDSVKPGRSGEDLLFQVILDWGLEATLPISIEQIDGKETFVVDEGALVACFEDNVTPKLVRELAALQPLRAIFRDSGFPSDGARINSQQIFKELSPATDMKVI